MVQAKFKVTSKTEWDNKTVTIELAPVTATSEENKSFWKWTPSGSITLNCLNPEASKQFEVGKEYYVDFTSAQ